MINIHLEESIVPEQITLTVSNMEAVNPFLNDESYQPSRSTSLGQFWIFFIKLEVEFIKGFIHEDFNHFVDITGFVQQFGPLSNFSNQIVSDVFHAFWPSMPIEHSEQTNQFPLTASNIFFNDQSIFLSISESDV